MLFALLGVSSLHADALEGVPTSCVRPGGLVAPLDARVGDLAACCRVRLADDFPLPGLVGKAVAALSSIGKTSRGAGAVGSGPLLGVQRRGPSLGGTLPDGWASATSGVSVRLRMTASPISRMAHLGGGRLPGSLAERISLEEDPPLTQAVCYSTPPATAAPRVDAGSVRRDPVTRRRYSSSP